jgi:uncharacterized membrane-anchored protein
LQNFAPFGYNKKSQFWGWENLSMSKGFARGAALLMALNFDAQANGATPDAIDQAHDAHEAQEAQLNRQSQRQELDNHFDSKDWDKALAQVEAEQDRDAAAALDL